VKESHTKLLIIGIILFVVIGLITTKSLGTKQDTTFQEHYQYYQLALQYIKEGNYQESAPIMHRLHEEYPESHLVSWYAGLSYAGLGDFVKASNLMQKSIDQRPFLLQDNLFTLQFGEVWYFLGEYEKSKLYLEQSKKFDIDGEFHARVDELLTLIDQNNK
jgi:tetratricopeptide (TPR) repeat protein